MKTKITIPDLNEITLGQYQDFLKIQENNPEGQFLDYKMISIFCNIPLKAVYNIKATSIDVILTKLVEVLNTKPKHIERFMLDDVEYGFIPDLQDISLGEYIDIDGNIGDWNNIHVAMNALYRPIKDKRKHMYNLVPYTGKNPEYMKNIPLSAALGSTVFFWNLGIELSKHMIQSSGEEVEGVISQQLQTSMQSGGGTQAFMASLTETLQSLKR